MQWKRSAQYAMYAMVEHRLVTLTQFTRIWGEAERVAAKNWNTIVLECDVQEAAKADGVDIYERHYGEAATR